MYHILKLNVKYAQCYEGKNKERSKKNETVCDLSSIELTEENLYACVYIYRYLKNYY